MSAVSKVAVLKDMSFTDVDFTQDKSEVLAQLNSLRSELISAFNLYNPINLDEVIVEVLNAVEQPLPVVKLYDPIFAHAVLHPPFDLTVANLDKVRLADYKVPNMTSKSTTLGGMLPSFTDHDLPDYDYDDKYEYKDTTTATESAVSGSGVGYATADSSAVVQNLGVSIDPLSSTVSEDVVVPLANGETDLLTTTDTTKVVSNSTDNNDLVNAIGENTVVPNEFIVDATEGEGKDVVVEINPDNSTINVVAKTVNPDTGEVSTVIGSSYDTSTTERQLIAAGLIGSIYLGGGVAMAVGRLDTIGETVSLISRVGSMSPMVLTDKGSLQTISTAMGEVYFKDRLMSYIRSAQKLATYGNPERGYKIMLVLAYWYPDYLRVASTGDIYVSSNWLDASYYFNSSDIYHQPIYISPVNLNPYVSLSNTPISLDTEYDLAPERVYSEVFGKSITSEIESWITQAVIEPWNIKAI